MNIKLCDNYSVRRCRISIRLLTAWEHLNKTYHPNQLLSQNQINNIWHKIKCRTNKSKTISIT